jgi:membrane associated rhomboid family serine protease
MHSYPTQDPHQPDNPEVLADLKEVGRYHDLALAHEHGLVILAMHEPCWVMPAAGPHAYSLLAQADAASGIAREIRAYEQEKAENLPSPAPDETPFPHSAGWHVWAIWMLVLVGCFSWQHNDPTLADHAASSSTGLIARGEWWRPFTALFLHSDVPHLVGNLVSGAIFGTLLARLIGPWRAWALILASGTVGNAITSVVAWPESFLSIGASTAVFGGLGILSGLAFAATLRARFNLPWARTAAPVIAGIVLLGWLGGGSEGSNTDVLGHVFGFSSGLAAGIVYGGLATCPLPARPLQG